MKNTLKDYAPLEKAITTAVVEKFRRITVPLPPGFRHYVGIKLMAFGAWLADIEFFIEESDGKEKSS